MDAITFGSFALLGLFEKEGRMWVYPLPGVRPSLPKGLRRDITLGYHCAAPPELIQISQAHSCGIGISLRSLKEGRVFHLFLSSPSPEGTAVL